MISIIVVIIDIISLIIIMFVIIAIIIIIIIIVHIPGPHSRNEYHDMGYLVWTTRCMSLCVWIGGLSII